MAETTKQITPETWEQIKRLRAEDEAESIWTGAHVPGKLRKKLIELAWQNQMSEQDFIDLQIIRPPRAPNPNHLKGGR